MMLWPTAIQLTDYLHHVLGLYSEVLDFLQRRIVELESQYLVRRIALDKNLSEWFVDPMVASSEPLEAAEATGSEFSTRRTYSFAKFRDVFQRTNRIVLIGAPGAGKSAVVAKLAVDLMREAFRQATADKKRSKVAVPLLMTARKLVSYEDLAELLSDQLSNADEQAFSVSVLLIDGLDEVEPAIRTTVLERASSYAKELGSSVVVTTRWIEALREPAKGFHQVELAEFKFDQAVKLFQKMLPSGVLLSSLTKGLEQIQGQLHMTPLTLVLLVEVAREYQEIPASVTELYDRFFDYALGRLDRDKGIEVLFEYHLKKVFLGELAHELFYSRGQLECSTADLETFAATYGRRYGIDATNIPKFLSEIERAGILRLDATRAEFCHRSFLDYFVAFSIHETSIDVAELNELLRELYFDRLWHEVSFFYVGLDRKVDSRLLDSIMAESSTDFSTRFMMFVSGRLLQAGWNTRVDIKERAIEAIVRLAPEMRDDVLEIVSSDKTNVPQVIGDVFLMMVGAHSFGSTFLVEASRRVVGRLLSAPTNRSLISALSLIGAMSERIDADERKHLVDSLLNEMSSLKLTPGDQARFLGALLIVDNKDDVRDAVEKRLRKVLRRHPRLAELVFSKPPKKIGRRRS